MLRRELHPVDSWQRAVWEGQAAAGDFSSLQGMRAGCPGILEHSSPVGATAGSTPAPLRTPWAGIANFRAADLQEYG